ncbi:MAG: hypothetical protein E7090_05280 [Bacteroidales bacterium]|nr:hypothetical protein [Bacteroidales bacterium]
MRKNLFLACALAFAATVGVSAQNWSRTLTRIVGESITHDIDGVTVKQHKGGTVETVKLSQPTNSIRFTVIETAPNVEIKGGGPCFALAEFIVLDANGDTVKYSNVNSNADHNTMGNAGNDGEGMPALNDGNLNNMFHSTWSASAPNAYHYIEMTLERSVSEFNLVWYGRPNNSKNNPSVAGLTAAGVDFTEDMLFAEYNFSQGSKATAEQVAAGGFFTFYVEGPTEYEDFTGPGNIYVALSGYTTGSATEASPANITQLIPTSNGDFIIYQPISDTYYGSADRWTDAYNGSNGWQRASEDASRLGRFEITPAANGEFEITTYVTREYKNDKWSDLDSPVKVWLGYDMRGNLKLFPESEKALLEAGNYESAAFHAPVDFTFRIDVANVNNEILPELTAAILCNEVAASTLELAAEKKEQYYEVIYESEGGPWDGADALTALDDAVSALNNAVASEDVAAVFEAKDATTKAIAVYVAQVANYYNYSVYANLQAEFDANNVTPPYTQDMTGAYTAQSAVYLQNINTLATEIEQDGGATLTYSQIEAKLAEIENNINLFNNSKLYFSEFPAQYDDVENVLADNHRSYTSSSVVLTEAVEGIRITFTKTNSTHVNQGYPQVVLAEFDLFDATGNEVALTADAFSSNSVENEGAIDNLCNGLIEAGAETVNTYEYWHSIWSGGAHNPEGHVYLDIAFPTPMDNFSFKFTGRNVSGSRDQQFPVSFVITNYGEKYDPLLFAENPYNTYVLEQVKNVSELNANDLYVVKGLLNTHDEYGVDEETGEPTGVAKFYEGVSRFHNSAAAVREGCVYRILPNGDGTYKLYSLKLAKYWPTTTDEAAHVTPTYSEAKAANLKIEAANGNNFFENTFVMYETHAGLQTTHEYDYNGDEVIDETLTYNTPYVVYMDWYGGVASRPCIDPQPRGGAAATALDAWGDSLCFNKGNGEGQWEIYRVKMDNPDFYLLSNMTGAIDELGLVVGTDPGCVQSLGDIETAFAKAVECVEDSNYTAAPAIAQELAGKISGVESLEKVPMSAGVYMIVSANKSFYENQGVNKAMYATVDEAGAATLGWANAPEGEDVSYYFDFQPSPRRDALLLAGDINADQAEQLYTIRAIATYNGPTAYYIGVAEEQSVAIELLESPLANQMPSYLVQLVNGSAFSLANYPEPQSWCIHANQHASGAGKSGNIVYWNSGAGASQWYLKKVDYTTSIEDLVTEGTEVVSVKYFTPAGAAVPAPVQGVNIVVTVYANGVVESKKVLVK